MDRRSIASLMAGSAAAWLAQLDEAQLEFARRSFPDDAERRLWFYTPTDHGGLTLAAMAPAQQQAAMRLVRCGLSEAAYVTTMTIIGLENVLDDVEGFRVRMGRERGRDPGMYYARVFGEPAEATTWGWRFGGHHVSVNHTIIDGALVASTPCFLGADPASSPLLGPHLLRPLAGAEDLGRELVRSLDDGQLDRALLAPVAPADLVTGNRPHASPGDRPLPLSGIFRGSIPGRGDQRMAAAQRAMEDALGLLPEHVDALALTAEPKGVRSGELSPSQRDLLRALLAVYVGRVPDELVDAEVAKFSADDVLDELAFAWAGGLHSGEPHYYRVQGPSLLAEYDNTQRGVNHIHTVYRDLTADFGGDVLAEHYARTTH